VDDSDIDDRWSEAIVEKTSDVEWSLTVATRMNEAPLLLDSRDNNDAERAARHTHTIECCKTAAVLLQYLRRDVA